VAHAVTALRSPDTGEGLKRARPRFGLFSFPAPFIAMVPVSIAIAVALALANPEVLRVTGDEPHYLVMSDALVHDRSFELRNAYAREAQTERIYGAPLPAPHVVIVNHRWGPYHEPGLAMLLAIPFAAGGVIGARLALCVFAALLPLCCFRWLRQRTATAIAAWLTVGLVVALPTSFGASQIYPDLPAGIITTALLLWLFDTRSGDAAPGPWATFWLVTGLLPWLNLKFLATTAALTIGAFGVLRDRHRSLRPAATTCALVAAGPLALAALHVWAFGSPLGPRGATELATSVSRGAMMFLGLHLDQGQGMIWQQPLIAAGIATLLPFARSHPRLALIWLGVYLSLIVPNSLELARFGGGSPAGRFGWSAMWLWVVPLGCAFERRDERRSGFARPVVVACLAYQALLAVRWLREPRVLFSNLEENLAARNSLFPVGLRAWLPSFYFWDFSSYWTYRPNLVAYAGIGLLLLSGLLGRRAGSGR
jgi:hypothetical protein